MWVSGLIYGFLVFYFWGVCFCSQYLNELLTEHQKLGPFMQVLPICSRLLNQGLFLEISLDFGSGGFVGFLDSGFISALLCICS